MTTAKSNTIAPPMLATHRAENPATGNPLWCKPHTALVPGIERAPIRVLGRPGATHARSSAPLPEQQQCELFQRETRTTAANPLERHSDRFATDANPPFAPSEPPHPAPGPASGERCAIREIEDAFIVCAGWADMALNGIASKQELAATVEHEALQGLRRLRRLLRELGPVLTDERRPDEGPDRSNADASPAREPQAATK